MRKNTPATWLARTLIPTMMATAVVMGQGTSQTPPKPASGTPQNPTQTTQPVFTKTVNYYTTDLRVRDAKGVFVPTLSKDDFELYEDGVLQKIEVFYPVIGGRPINAPTVTTAAPRSTSGLIVPKQKVQTDTSG